MRLISRKLDTFEMTDVEWDTLPKRFKGKKSEQSPTLSSSDSVVIESIKKRRIADMSSVALSSISTPLPAQQMAKAISSPLPPSSSMPTLGTKRKDPPTTAYSSMPLTKTLHVDVTDGSVLKDAISVSKSYYDWVLKRKDTLESKLEEARTEIADLQRELGQYSRKRKSHSNT